MEDKLQAFLKKYPRPAAVGMVKPTDPRPVPPRHKINQRDTPQGKKRGGEEVGQLRVCAKGARGEDGREEAKSAAMHIFKR
jgi:hypothetical protein